MVDTSALLEEETEPVVAQYTSRNSYFTDALIEDVIQALMEEFGYDYYNFYFFNDM